MVNVFVTAANCLDLREMDGLFVVTKESLFMESLAIKTFQLIFKFIVNLMMCGMLVSVLLDLQTAAFHSKKLGLVSMLHINQQLVGKTK